MRTSQRAAPLHDRDVGRIVGATSKDAGEPTYRRGACDYSGRVIVPLMRKVWPVPAAVVEVGRCGVGLAAADVEDEVAFGDDVERRTR